MSETPTSRTQQHWAEAVAECVTDEQEALRLVRMYEEDEWPKAMLDIGRTLLATRRALTAERAARERAEANLLCPGQMRCAKCKFELTRRTLFVQSGTVGAGSSETEPCPNGCGPLWPVTWEQEARACYAAMDRLFDEKQRAEAERDALLARVRDDSLAMTCQSIGQYRTALLAKEGS